MDPLGPWATYNPSYSRLTGATGSYQVTASNGRGNFGSPLHASPTGNNGLENSAVNGLQSTNSQLLLQTAHSSASLTNRELIGHTTMSAAFGAGSFLTQTSASYDPIFTTLFHHSEQKPSNYGQCTTSNAQKHSLQHTSATKQNTLESDLTRVREKQQNNTYFEQQAAGSPSSLPSPSSWSHQANAQLPSPFGILPHETVGNGMEKGSICEGDYNVQFTPNQNLSNMNSQLSPALEYNKPSSDYNKIQIRKPDKLLSPGRTAFQPAPSSSASATFYQHAPPTFSTVGVVSSRDNTSVVRGTNYQNDSSKCQQQIPGVSDFVSSGKGFVSPVQLPTQYHQPSLDTKLYSEYNSSEHMTQPHLSEEHSQSPPVNFSVLNNTRQTVNFTHNENSGTCSTNIGSVSVPTSVTVEEQHGRRDLGTPQTIHRRQLNSDASFPMQQYSGSLVENASYGSSPSFPTEAKSYSEPLLCIANDSLKHSQSDCGSLPQTHSPVSTHSHPSPLGHNPSPLGHTPSPLGHVPSPLSHVPSPLSHVQSPRGHVPSPLGHVPSPLGHNLSPHGHNLSPHGHIPSPRAHALSPAYPVYHSPVGMVPSASYVQPLSPEISLRQCSSLEERPKIVSHTAKNESAQPLGGLPKSQVPAQPVINHTSNSTGVAQRQKLDECDNKDQNDLHGKRNCQGDVCQKQNEASETKEQSSIDKSSPYYKVYDSERVGGDSTAAATLSVAQTGNLSQTSTLLQRENISGPTVSMEEEGYIEHSTPHSKQLSNNADKLADTDYNASLQEEDESRGAVSISTDEVGEAHTNEHSSHLNGDTSEEQHLVSAEESVTENCTNSLITPTDGNQEQQDTDSWNSPLNEKLHSPEASVACDNVLEERSVSSQDSMGQPDNEYQSVTASVAQATATDFLNVEQSSDSIQQLPENTNMSSEMESASQQPPDFVESFNEINRKVTLINIEDDLECLLEDGSFCSPLTLEQDVNIPQQKYFLQNRSGFLDGYMKFLNEERKISVAKTKSIEKTLDKDTHKKVQRKQSGKNAGIAGTSTKFSKHSDSLSQSQQDEDYEESSYNSDVTSDTSETETLRSKGKRTEWMSGDNTRLEDEGSERKRQKMDEEENPEKHKKNAKDCRGKGIQRSKIQLRQNSSCNQEISSKCNSFQSLDSENSNEKELRKRSRNVKDQVIAKRKMSEHKEDETVGLPRREMTPRKAKEMNNTKKYTSNNLEEFEEDSDSEDIDSDPAWTPAAKEPSDDDNINRRRSRRSRYMLTSCKRARHSSPDDTGRGSTEDLQLSKLRGSRTRQSRSRTHSSAIGQHSHSMGRTDIPSIASNSPVGEIIADTNFRSGDFVIMKSDTAMEQPPLWRIDGRTLLQKYESFEQSGKMFYRNISTYTSWSPQNRHIYQQVAVRFIVQNQFETVVELMKNDTCDDHQAMIEQSLRDTAKFYNSFEVYIQTLISQALDSNFLTEVLREHDDYFLTNLKRVDGITEERMQNLLRIAKWPNTLRTSVGTWPCFNVIDEPTDGDGEGAMSCIACEHSSATARVQMYGQPYDRTTLEGCPPDPKLASQKDFLLCKVCVSRVELYNKVAHQKYHMYVECAKRVADKRSCNSSKDSMEILNELLADELWLRELFLTVRHVWAEIDTLDHQS